MNSTTNDEQSREQLREEAANAFVVTIEDAAHNVDVQQFHWLQDARRAVDTAFARAMWRHENVRVTVAYDVCANFGYDAELVRALRSAFDDSASSADTSADTSSAD